MERRERTWRLDDARFVVRHLDEESIVLDLRSGDYFTIDGAAALGLRVLLEGKTVSDAVDAVERTFDVPDRVIAERDFVEFLSDLERKGILKSDL